MYDFQPVERDLDALEALGLPYCEMLVQKDHQVLFHAHRGQEGLGKRFFLYSCSKLMTVTGVLRLVERGLVELDAPVARYLPAFEKAFLLENGVRRAPETVMTVRHLFTMSGGLDYDFSKPPIRTATAQPGANTVSVVNSFVESPLCFNPGDRFQYSLCHDVLAAVAEQVTGKPFGQYMQEEVFGPLGMTRTSFSFQPEEIAPQYRFDEKTRAYEKTPCECVYMLNPNYYSGGAGVVSTADDMARLVDALACKGQSREGYALLRPETVALLHTEQLSRLVKDPAFGCPAGPGYSYGLGVRVLVDKSQGQPSPLGEFGWDGAAGSYELCDCENGVSIAFITHVSGWTAIRPVFHAPLRNAVYQALRIG